MSSGIPTSLVSMLLENMSLLFIRMCAEPVWAQCPMWQDDPWDSMRLFLLGYAFEHQGRAQDFGPAAADAIAGLRQRTSGPNPAIEVWNAFSGKLKNRGLNCAVNPLCPRGTSYTRKGTKLRTGQLSVVEFATEALNGQPLVAWARDRLREGAIRDAHGSLSQVNGIGPKIASLFLRDVAVRLNLPLRNSSGRELLQPIDVWVRLVARKLSGEPKLNDPGCAEYLASKLKRPERLNQGIWYFCTRVADSSRYVVEKVLRDEGAFLSRVQEHLGSLRKGATIADEFEHACLRRKEQA